MTFNKITRTLIPPTIGYLTFLICDGLFQKFFPTEPPDDLSTPGIVFLLEYVVMFVWTIIVFTFQYKVIVPKTLNSTKRPITLTLVIGLVISLFFAFMHYISDNGTFKEITITFFRVFIQVESFVLGNLTLIVIFNKLTYNTELKQYEDQKNEA
jgi:hypothetical protein